MPRLRLPRRSSASKATAPRPLYNARVIVGLGNPGPRYVRHRHNVGARTIALLSETLGIPLEHKGKLALSGQGGTDYGPVVLAQPLVFMNESGRAVQSLLTQQRAKPSQLILIVDELDIEVGRIRVRDGVESAMNEFNTSPKSG